ncbi:MAG: AarF/ABC1/UbiB kinase family protein [Methylotenera sp.]|nr:AarF/ABC1/UbiB kinase family protein [Oligoflexia bacterium]
MAKKSASKLKAIRSSSLSRGFALAKMTLSAGAQAAGHAVGNLFSDESNKEDRVKALLLSQTTLLANELGTLKGSLMKVGQMLSMFGEHLLPPEANAVLKSLQSQSPPLEWKAIEKVIKRRLTAEQLATLDIEREPLASASLGQVHLATRKSDGQKIALKIQYPGVDQAIETDIKAMRSLLSMTKLIPGGHKYDELFKEVREMLHREVDYRRELESTLEFKELLSDDPRFVIPTPFPELSGKKILATSFEAGVSVDSAEVAALSLERRSAIGKAAYELFLREVFEFRKVQTDPHFGNYRIRIAEKPDRSGVFHDQMILFDFGAIRDIPQGFLRGYRQMIEGAFTRDEALLRKGAYEMEILREDDSQVAKQRFTELCLMVMEPSRRPDEEAYAWGKSDLAARAMSQGRKLAFDFKLRPPPRESVFIDRKAGGVFIFLSVLKAEFNPAPLLRKHLERNKF